jgi:hypothetical protein
MPRKIQSVTKDFLVNVPLPTHGSSYTVISHKSIIDYAYAELAAQGFTVKSEEFRCSLDGQIAQGIHILNYATDPELSMIFTWTNSYNKQVKFKCAVGVNVEANQSVMLTEAMGSYLRKHVGAADADVIASMKDQISNAKMYYDLLAADKNFMVDKTLSYREQAQLLGILFAEYNILSTEQASLVRQEMGKPSFAYNGGNTSLWAFYNHVTYALQQSHPKTWMEDQRILHYLITKEYDLRNPNPQTVTEEIDLTVINTLENNYGEPENQTNLLVQIAEAEAMQVQHPVSPDFATYIQGTDPVSETPSMSAEVVVFDVTKPEEPIETIQDYIERTTTEDADHIILEGVIYTNTEEPQKIATILDETVEYTDPAGNTFEAPVVHTPSLEPTPEDYAEFEKEELPFDLDVSSDEEEEEFEDDDFFL